ncbi:protein ABHD8-like isoform X1 [Amphibalanus amphitrite]|uniref:protein ABHD8-like isoform X1 n=1 Tax=Amphibalanus amphitrite TaxID=1232801 RepID=UPI001C8FC3C7|nr:protein ABHD8-like isoform X1 [Amphibalanus amphitrite]XP_043206476.1 protein ABHD8-like isoform X1 [Amphibalanus amphitrite]XP_043206477.1 protein ABHD8-like isoform X1 [Amphibalanus amphitrite]XP_043226550.1 protein ABHD8-like isoform X1 [Amphibalanus amphitrite]XP_043226551.1 protein ABHD8-like isoform X1 [Amphibalanus amphitrite]
MSGHHQTNSLYDDLCEGLENARGRVSRGCTMAVDLCCPCLRRNHRVAPSPVKSPNQEFVEVSPRGRLRVLHVLPYQVPGQDEPDALRAQQDNDVPTSDFWFNHWQGPHISASGAPRRKTSTNTFGPADAAGRARKTSMSAPVSLAETSVRQLLDDLVDEAVDYSSGPAPPPGPPHPLTERPDDEQREEDAADGRANPAYEPSADDPADAAAAVRLPDATTDETETDDERDTPPPSHTQPVPPPPSQTHQPQPHTHQPKTTAADQKTPLLFFLHGVGGSADVWTSQIKYFSKLGYECVAPDLLGHGFSSAPSSPRHYSFQWLLEHVRSVFKKYATSRRRVVVIGHSYGSSFASVLAREYLNVVLLVLISCGGPTPLAAPSDVFSLPVWVLSCLKPLLICGFKTREMFYTPRGKLIEVEKGFDVPSYVLSHTMRGQVWPEGDLGYHKQITLPTLLIHGMKDKFVSLVEMCDMEKAIPRAFLESIPNAGHMVMLEAPDETSRLIRQFLDRWLHQTQQPVTAS